MFGPLNFVGTAAAASVVLSVAAPHHAAATPVAVESVHWQFYQGGWVRDNPDSGIVLDDFYYNLPDNAVTATDGGATFSSTAAFLNSTVNGADTFSFSSLALLAVNASVSPTASQGAATAFSTLNSYNVEFRVTDSPWYYFGDHELAGPSGPIVSGDLLEPGLYSFSYVNSFGLDAYVDIGPGDSGSDDAVYEFTFNFSPVPGPGTAAFLAPALLVIGRRRRN